MIEVNSKLHRAGIYAILGIPASIGVAVLGWPAWLGVPLGVVGGIALIFTLATRDGNF